MNERRLNPRYLVNLNVTLYGDGIGHLDGHIHDVSSGGMYINITDTSMLNKKINNGTLFVRPSNMDTLFSMECLRVEDGRIGLKFVE